MKRLLFFFVAASLSCAFIESQVHVMEPGDIDNALFDDFFDTDVFKVECTPFTPQEVLAELTKLNLPNILLHNLYKHTNNPVIRPLFDLPTMMPQFDRCEDRSFSCQAFFNQMRKVYLTCNSSSLSSYLNLTDEDLLEQFDIELLESVNIPDLGPLLANIRLEERRAGAMLAFYKEWGCTSASFLVPFYWLEHNFFLNDEDVAAIQRLPFIQSLPPSDDDQVKTFAFKHLVDTKFGIGDIRFYFDHNVVDKWCTDLWLGFQFTAPTARAFNGPHFREWFGDTLLFGGNFCKTKPLPTINYEELLCLAAGSPDAKAVAFETLTDLLLGSLDQLTANLADRSLGQQHFSIGPTFYCQQYLTPIVSIIAYAGVDYWFPRREIRFFLVNKNPADFAKVNADGQLAIEDPDALATNIASADNEFLAIQTVNFLYPTAICIDVRPGFVAKASIALAFDSYHTHVALGYDYWRQGNEKLIMVPENLNAAAGLRPKAFQNKFFGRIFAHHRGAHHDIRFGIRGDATASSRGIGKDFTLALDVLIDF